jgi:D-3-phosphoglycerate dehydrogenase
MNVLIADKVPGWFVEKLKAAGCNVLWEPALDGDTLTAAITAHDPAVVIVRSTKVQKPQIEAGAGLKMIIRAGAGVNTIDVACATGRGVKVTNCPGTNSAAVAELAIGHLINLDRRIADGAADLKAGRWNKNGYSKARGLKGRTLGVLGMGNIGILVTRVAQALGMQIVTWDPFLSQEKADELGVRKTEDLLEVARASDAVTIHLALVPPTRGLVGAEFFAAMKKGAYLINTSRAEVVEKAALVAAIQEKGLRVGTDVFWTEPGANDTAFADDIAQLPGVYGTHHIGASTDQAQDAVSDVAWQIMDTFLTTGQIINAVN